MSERICIFTIPKPFRGHIATIQRNALRSWTLIEPRPDIILFGNEEGNAEIADEFGLLHIPDIAVNEFGTPLISDVFATAQRVAAGAICAYVNTDMILLREFSADVTTLRGFTRPALMVGRRYDLMVWEPVDFSHQRWEDQIKSSAAQSGLLDACSGIDYFVFQSGFYGDIPPFAVGRTYWDNWLLWYARQSGAALIDATRRIVAIHQEHPYTHVTGGATQVWNGVEARRNWELSGGNIATIKEADFCLDDDGIIPIYPDYQLPEPGLQEIFEFKYRLSIEAYLRGENQAALDLLDYIALWSPDRQLPEAYCGHRETILAALKGVPDVAGEATGEDIAGRVIEEALAPILEEARTLFRRGRTDESIQTIISRGIPIAPMHPEPYRLLADLLILSGRYSDALSVLSEAPADSTFTVLAELKAFCMAMLGDDNSAESCAREIIRTAGERPRALEVLATLAARRNDTRSAAGLFQRARELDPSRAEPLIALAILSWGSGNKDEAYRLLRESVALSPVHGTAVRLFREAAGALSRQADLIVLMGELLERTPDAKEIIIARAAALEETGNDAGALECLELGMAHIGYDDDLLDAALAARHRIGPYTRPASAGRPSVSLCMIVKNEARTLHRCLASAKPAVDEIIVADTGSDDRTVALATVFGARVFTLPWNNDFAAARNAAIQQATGDWILVLDADEVLAEKDRELLKNTVSDPTTGQTAWSVTTRNYSSRSEQEGWTPNDGSYPLEEAGDGWYPSSKVRLFPNDSRYRFRGEIHEMVEESLRECGTPIRPAGFVVHHYGELDIAGRFEKQLRYYEGGKQKLATRPDHIPSLIELGIQAGELKLYHEALDYWNRLLELGVHSRDIWFNRSYALIGLNRYAEAADCAARALASDPEHKESAVNLGTSLLCLGRPGDACQAVAPTHSRNPDYPLLSALLCVIYLALGDKRAAEPLYTRLTDRQYGISSYIHERISHLKELGQTQLADSIEQAASGLGNLPRSVTHG